MSFHVQTENELDGGSTLVSRNITVNARRTSVRLEPEMWRALKEISTRESCSIHELCTLISFRKNKRTSLTAAIRVFLMLYFRAATTEDGHGKAGHGSFDSMKRRAGWHERGLNARVHTPPGGSGFRRGLIKQCHPSARPEDPWMPPAKPGHDNL